MVQKGTRWEYTRIAQSKQNMTSNLKSCNVGRCFLSSEYTDIWPIYQAKVLRLCYKLIFSPDRNISDILFIVSSKWRTSLHKIEVLGRLLLHFLKSTSFPHSPIASLPKEETTLKLYYWLLRCTWCCLFRPVACSFLSINIFK